MSDRTLVHDFVEGFDNPRTRHGYGDALDLWRRWLDTQHLELLTVDRRDIERWKRHLETEGSNGRPNQRSTVAGRLHVLASFYKWCVIEDLIVRNPMLHVRRPKVPEVGAGTALKRQEFAAVLDVVVGRPVEHALICLLGYNGCRIRETLGIQVTDLRMEGAHSLVLVHRKGDKDQELSLNRRTHAALQVAVDDRLSGSLLINPRTGRVLTYHNALRIATSAATRAGIERRVTPHSYRRTFVTLSRDANVPSRDVASACGHADERTISKYDRNRQAHDRNPTHLLEHWVAGAA